MLATTFLCYGSLRVNGQVDGNRSTIVADALSWYSMWMTGEWNIEKIQICRGELRDSSYQFRCDPLKVVVSVRLEDSGACVITNMRHALFPQDGIKMARLPELTGRRLSKNVQCGELPTEEGMFEITIKPRMREVSQRLTAEAHDAGSEYMRRGGQKHCILRFPNVREGDPFFHLYEECAGSLQTVWEFTVRQDMVAASPHWFYTQKRLPEGADERRKRTALWSVLSEQN
jgi:hypothetical protein